MVPFSKYNGKGRSSWATETKAVKKGVFRGGGNTIPLQECEDDSRTKTKSLRMADVAEGVSTEILSSTELTYTCNSCGEKANAHRKGFDLKNLGQKIMCYSCKKLRRSKDWMCECGNI